MVLETRAQEKENELLNAIRFADLPKVGNTETQGGTKMGSLTKLAESHSVEEKSAGLFEKVAEEEVQYSSADRIKIACAHLTNFIAAATQKGFVVKEASSKGEIDPDLIVKTAQLYVIDSYDLYKEAGISREGLMKLIDKIRQAAINVGTGAKDLGARGLGGARDLGLRGWEGAKGLGMRGLNGTKGLGVKGFEGAKTLAGKKGVQIGAAGVGGLGLGYGLSELLND